MAPNTYQRRILRPLIPFVRSPVQGPNKIADEEIVATLIFSLLAAHLDTATTKVSRVGARAPALWSAPAERSGDGALAECNRKSSVHSSKPKRGRRFALPPHSINARDALMRSVHYFRVLGRTRWQCQDAPRSRLHFTRLSEKMIRGSEGHHAKAAKVAKGLTESWQDRIINQGIFTADDADERRWERILPVFVLR